MHRPIVFFCMPDRGHFQRLRPLIRGLSDLSVPVQVFTHQHFRSEIEQAGGAFVDLFSKYPIDGADRESWPLPVRFVSFAAHYAEAISRDVRAVGPSLIVHDTFAVIGSVVSRALGLPHVNVCAGHAIVPERFLAIMRELPIVKVASECHAAVETLRTRYGMHDASPFSYLSELSGHLNVYCEPPEFLDEADRAVFEPIAFYGSLHPDDRVTEASLEKSLFADAPDESLRVYISFGTNIWDYRKSEALAAMLTLVDTLERDDHARAVIGLGGTDIDRNTRSLLTRSNVAVEDYVDQWSVLREADVFVTHHGLNSTHEAVFQSVPMLSYPFIWDQPALARKCQELGFATSLADTPMAKISTEDVVRAMNWIRQNRRPIASAIAEARGWEEAVMATRPAVHRRILDLCE